MKESRSIHRYIMLVLGMALTLAVAGIAAIVLIPERIHEREESDLANRAQWLAAYISDGISSRSRYESWNETRKRLRVDQIDRDFVFAAVVDEKGNVDVAWPEALESDTSWSIRSAQGGPVVTASALLISEGFRSRRVHVGLSTARIVSQRANDQLMAIILCGLLMVMAVGAAIGALQLNTLGSTAAEWQRRHQSLQRQTGTLASSVKVHRQTEQTLRKSEEKYRSLFQTAMSAAMRDLEDLNSHLEQRKADLETEVGTRKRAEAVLRRYTERLQLLNDVERTMLEGRPLSETVEIALKRLRILIGVDGATLYEVRSGKDSPVVLGRSGMAKQPSLTDGGSSKSGCPDSAWAVLHPAEVTMLADGTKEIRYQADASKANGASGVAADLRDRFVECSINSYCFVPLVVEAETVGLLLLGSKAPNALDNDSFDVARDMADLLAIGIRQDRHNSERERYESELIAARDRAEEMARLKSAFLTNMSHEIRTPISGIMGFAQVLHEEAPDSLQEFTGLIHEAANRLLNTINSVLELARIESGRILVQTESLDVGRTVRETVRLIEPLAQRKGIGLVLDVEEKAIRARLDRACVERIVNNLVGNAIKFTDEGEVRVGVESDDVYVRLVVSDTGVGISDDFLPHLFDEFRQEQMGATREHEGSGLGLAITKKLVDRLGGDIQVETGPAGGTTFIVQFLREADEEAQEADRPRGRILVMTSNGEAASLLHSRLVDNWMCTEVPELSQALETAEKEPLAAFIIDVNGLEGHSYHGVQELRAINPNALLIAIATQYRPREIDRLLDVGFDQFVANPFEGDELAQALSRPRPRADRAPVRHHPAAGTTRRKKERSDEGWTVV